MVEVVMFDVLVWKSCVTLKPSLRSLKQEPYGLPLYVPWSWRKHCNTVLKPSDTYPYQTPQPGYHQFSGISFSWLIWAFYGRLLDTTWTVLSLLHFCHWQPDNLTPAVQWYYFQKYKYCGSYLLSPPEVHRKTQIKSLFNSRTQQALLQSGMCPWSSPGGAVLRRVRQESRRGFNLC